MTTTTPPTPSALTTLITSITTPTPPETQQKSSQSQQHPALTHQVLHNLQHQHLWTSLQIHQLQAPSSTSSNDTTADPNPITLISGIPPHRLYTHPDEQLYLLERGLREEDLELERMFVLPTVQGQTWSLRRLAGVFDGFPLQEEFFLNKHSGSKTDKLREYYRYREKARATREWGGKRLLLAMVDRQMGGDSTVVYYVVQDGAVKPRQN
ncbi:uncharacterized protein BO97DRAFT_350664 [Aspergillus homomorphus CBS 101889]|uniref:tRNA-splicing endonuclease subunit Sen15 domain-containing protein n=1 Tax=Aspergillus homomorphus (strain CBS 101889) TaxID=1450537 RepID=A0A395HPW5_ASPHC|nr:hypothetical protein BO97DRAFT_350664 [Aspergillus homomorphus CBS 101889]RAL09981.1 hypothetical protein BO97DRAFT_350664 [Aspergillus homomorphus CBS 101889]